MAALLSRALFSAAAASVVVPAVRTAHQQARLVAGRPAAPAAAAVVPTASSRRRLFSSAPPAPQEASSSSSSSNTSKQGDKAESEQDKRVRTLEETVAELNRRLVAERELNRRTVGRDALQLQLRQRKRRLGMLALVAALVAGQLLLSKLMEWQQEKEAAAGGDDAADGHDGQHGGGGIGILNPTRLLVYRPPPELVGVWEVDDEEDVANYALLVVATDGKVRYRDAKRNLEGFLQSYKKSELGGARVAKLQLGAVLWVFGAELQLEELPRLDPATGLQTMLCNGHRMYLKQTPVQML